MSKHQVRLQQAWQQHQTGNLDEAEETYRQVIEADRKDADAWVYLGILQFDRRQFESSTESYRRALEIRDHYPIAWNNLGNSFRMLGQVENAEQCFTKALSQHPNYLSAFKNRGTLWIWSGEIQKGLRVSEGLKHHRGKLNFIEIHVIHPQGN